VVREYGQRLSEALGRHFFRWERHSLPHNLSLALNAGPCHPWISETVYGVKARLSAVFFIFLESILQPVVCIPVAATQATLVRCYSSKWKYKAALTYQTVPGDQSGTLVSAHAIIQSYSHEVSLSASDLYRHRHGS
jgi:hypothetical protein